MGEVDGGALVGCVGGVLVVVDGGAGEQGTVEDASFGRFALVVEVVEEFGELVQAGANAVLFDIEEVEGDRVGVVGLDKFEAFGFELVALGGQGLAFVLAESFVLVEEIVEDLPDVHGLGLAEGVALVARAPTRATPHRPQQHQQPDQQTSTSQQSSLRSGGFCLGESCAMVSSNGCDGGQSMSTDARCSWSCQFLCGCPGSGGEAQRSTFENGCSKTRIRRITVNLVGVTPPSSAGD
ncbi:hypothetical protein [Gephyromycinifex aptenodytis]|uniref:hypothetical protein n=1 Tax=Gephyromycinifex aptenodytis TaxID=2716227 RepID=UPI001B30003B|nr:hypothetical protein [Gephyromycinifex aptenodytis]